MFFRRKPGVPPVVNEVRPDPSAASEDLSKASALHQSAKNQAAQADEVVFKLARSRVRNGFAPAIEESIMHKYLGGSAS